ncbi:MAG: phenylalanine--tRNA ligase subunit alpha [archaeon]|jgi:phenylalanyl-tRNA synthetase alpha chain|nr:phenylalanine--tRNA ligase subunit alpha [archaeon]
MKQKGENPEKESKETEAIVEKLSPLEIKIIPFLKESIDKIEKKSGLDSVSVLRALKFLEAKGIVKLRTTAKTLVDLGTNGVYYKKNNLPERQLLMVLEKNHHLDLEEAKKLSKLSENEFKVSLGVLRSKALINMTGGKISLNAGKEELSKKSFEEQLLDALPAERETLPPELHYALDNLKKRKDIVEIKEKSVVEFELTSEGRKIAGKEIKSELLEEVTPEIIRDWQRGKKFRKYDILAPVPAIHGGKRHFVNEAITKGKRIWTDLGFKEMTGSKTTTSFWNFDALFTAQDHPVREIHDTFFIKGVKGALPDKELVSSVKKAHESGVGNSRGWQYKWNEETARRVLIRTHTTILSAQTLAKLKKEDMPAKFFAVGKCFRNETVDWKHLFEFNQTEGIVIDPNANLRHLIGYLKEFARKMGFEKIKIQPSYFPYTEPSLEGLAWNEEKKQWVEVLAAGIFRPEVTIPLLGTATPVLAWGPGFDRLMMAAYGISDMRELYSNDLKALRNKKAWIK